MPPIHPAPVPAPIVSRLVLSGLVVALGGGGLCAQTFDLLVSTSADSDLWGQPVADEDVVLHPSGQTARVAVPAASLAALAGDDGSGLHLGFGDVDALHVDPSALVGDGLLVSLVSDEHGLRDGDVFGFGPDGPQVVLSEDELLVAIGSVDGNLDVDAIHRDGSGTWFFSLAEDEESTTLSGDLPGEIQDGAILGWVPGSPAAFVVHTESAVDALVAAALGGSGGGDVKGLARDPITGALIFSVQSPSAHDASVFSEAGGGLLVDGHQESDFGFGAATELDALAVAPVTWPGLVVDEPRPPAGGSVTFTVRGEPGALHLVLISGGLAASGKSLHGWGGLALAPDAFFVAATQALPALLVTTDGLGGASLSLDIPAVQPALDVYVQGFGLGPAIEASNPLVVEVAQ